MEIIQKRRPPPYQHQQQRKQILLLEKRAKEFQRQKELAERARAKIRHVCRKKFHGCGEYEDRFQVQLNECRRRPAEEKEEELRKAAGTFVGHGRGRG